MIIFNFIVISTKIILLQYHCATLQVIPETILCSYIALVSCLSVLHHLILPLPSASSHLSQEACSTLQQAGTCHRNIACFSSYINKQFAALVILQLLYVNCEGCNNITRPWICKFKYTHHMVHFISAVMMPIHFSHTQHIKWKQRSYMKETQLWISCFHV